MTHPRSRTLALALVVLLASCASDSQVRPSFTISLTPTTVPPTSTISPAPTVSATFTILSAPANVPPTSTVEEVGADDTTISIADGYIADGESLSPFDTDYPAISNLDHDLLAAVQRASTDAAHDGVEMLITSGWRSVRYQQTLLDEAVATYGSLAEARKWVNTPEKSTHVSGQAVDIGPVDAMRWLSQHGNGYGLCQTYANELWHYELATTPGGTCPLQISDASAGLSLP
jgi:zinc D-Ala-D-Ala carboxypeptidase